MASVCAVALALPGCGGSDEAANTTAADNGMNAMMADTGPFADIEMRMNDAMMAAVGVDVGDTWVRKMIEHHKGAVEMSRQVLTMTPNARVAEVAQQTIDKQTREIAELQSLVAQGNPDPASGALYRPAIEQMHQAMMTASGADPSETFLRKMLAHHQGAVAMSDVALANGVSGPLRAQIEKTKSAQQREIEMIEALLRGEPLAEAAQEPSAVASRSQEAAEPGSSPAVTATDEERPKAEPKPAPEQAPADPHAGHDMNSMNSM